MVVGRPLLSAALSVAQRVIPKIAGRRPVGSPPPGSLLPDSAPAEAPAPQRRAELAPMRPVRPSAAENDNPLGALRTEVERDLRAQGYLR